MHEPFFPSQCHLNFKQNQIGAILFLAIIFNAAGRPESRTKKNSVFQTRATGSSAAACNTGKSDYGTLRGHRPQWTVAAGCLATPGLSEAGLPATVH